MHIGLLLLITMSVPGFAAPEIINWKTSSGTNVYFVETHNLPIVDVQVVFDAGSVRDPGDKRGLSLLVNSLLELSADGLNADQISFEFERLGAEYSGQSGYDSASVSLRSLSNQSKLAKAVEMLHKVLAFPEFQHKDFERQRNNLLVSIQRKHQSPRSIAKERFDHEIYQGHPYGYANEGSAETLAQITRKDLLNFHKRFYTTMNAMISIVGDIERKSAEKLAEELLKSLSEGQANKTIAVVQDLERGKIIKIPHPSTQVHILTGQPGIKYGDPDYFPLYVGNHILGGGGMMSRLYEEVREKRGLSYSVSSYFSPRRVAGPFMANAQTREDQADQALAVLMETITEFRDNGPSKAELAAAKKNITGSFPLRTDSNRETSRYISVIGFYGLPIDYLDTFSAKVEAVTVEDIKASFQNRMDVDRFITVMAGPVDADQGGTAN